MSSSRGGQAPMRNLYQETSDELQAKLDLMPQILSAEATFGPAYTQLDLNNLAALMNGTQASTRTVNTTRNVDQAGWYDSSGNYLGNDRGMFQTAENPNWQPGVGWAGQVRTVSNGGLTETVPAGTRWIGRNGRLETTAEVTTPGSAGLLSLMEQWSPRLAAIDAANLSAQREADIADVARLGGASREAMDLADPQTANLLRLMTESASTDLALGARLNPEQERQIRNSTMGAAGARGWSMNPGDLARTAMATTDYGQQLEDRRRQYAAGITGLRGSYYGDAFNRVLGRPVSTTTSQLYGQGMSSVNAAGPRLFGSSVNANDVFSSNQNAAASNNAAAANNRASMIGTGIGALGMIGAALI